MASFLITAFGGYYADFHDKPNNVSRGIFRAFVKGCVKMFSKISVDIDKTSTLFLAKFAKALSISFGPDRALYANKDCDQCW
jgi:hypothetical protein